MGCHVCHAHTHAFGTGSRSATGLHGSRRCCVRRKADTTHCKASSVTGTVPLLLLMGPPSIPSFWELMHSAMLTTFGLQHPLPTQPFWARVASPCLPWVSARCNGVIHSAAMAANMLRYRSVCRSAKLPFSCLGCSGILQSLPVRDAWTRNMRREHAT